MSVIGDNIKALRQLHGLTQQELADLTGVTRETVNKWETGSIGNVRTSHVEVLRERFSLTVDDLRSESCGLAAKAHDLATPNATTPARVPLRGVPVGGTVEVPASLRARHPRAFAWAVTDGSVARSLPVGCHAVVDPDATPTAGSIVLAGMPGSEKPALRHLSMGATKALLSTDDGDEDMVVDLGELDVRGVVIWFQAAAELG